MNPLHYLYTYLRMKWNFRFYSQQQIIRFQKERLHHLLDFLKTNSTFYMDKIDLHKGPMEQLSDLPILDKNDFMSSFNEINTRDLKKKDLISFSIQKEKEGKNELFRDEFSIGMSSGTSGNKTLTVLDSKERMKYGIALLARNGTYGFFRRKILFALRRNNPAYSGIERFGHRLHFVDYTTPIDNMISCINKHKLNVLAGPPSLLLILSRRCNEILPDIRFVVSYAEVLNPWEKRKISQRFKAPVSQIYQGAEGFLAHTCRKGQLHLNEDLIHFELETMDKANPLVKNVIITDLHRKTLPFVRYKLNDVIEIDERQCSCGSSFQLVKQIHGRKDDIFILKGISEKFVYLFPDYVRRSINQASADIKEYQAVLVERGTIEIRLIITEDADVLDIQDNIRKNINRYLSKIGAQPVQIICTSELPERNPHSNKLIRVINRVD